MFEKPSFCIKHPKSNITAKNCVLSIKTFKTYCPVYDGVPRDFNNASCRVTDRLRNIRVLYDHEQRNQEMSNGVCISRFSSSVYFLTSGKIRVVIPIRELRKQNPVGSNCFYLYFDCCPGRYFAVSKSPNYIRLFELLKMLCDV